MFSNMREHLLNSYWVVSPFILENISGNVLIVNVYQVLCQSPF